MKHDNQVFFYNANEDRPRISINENGIHDLTKGKQIFPPKNCIYIDFDMDKLKKEASEKIGKAIVDNEEKTIEFKNVLRPLQEANERLSRYEPIIALVEAGVIEYVVFNPPKIEKKGDTFVVISGEFKIKGDC